LETISHNIPEAEDMPWIANEELSKMGFAHVGRDVRISDKAVIHDPGRVSIGDFSRIDDFCTISGSVTICRNVHIAVFCNLAGGIPGITLEDFSGLAYGCQVFAQSDDYSGHTMTNPTVPEKFKGVKRAAVRIGRHVIVGTHAIVFPGVHVAEGCSAGAQAVLMISTKPWGIYTGHPAKRIKERSKDLLTLEAQYLKEIAEN
jgi:galactoside O-acetyltransferase